MRKFQANFVEKIKPHILRSGTFFFLLKSCRLLDNVEKYLNAGETTDYNTVRAHFTLDS